MTPIERISAARSITTVPLAPLGAGRPDAKLQAELRSFLADPSTFGSSLDRRLSSASSPSDRSAEERVEVDDPFKPANRRSNVGPDDWADFKTAVWLRFGFLDEAHQICQSREGRPSADLAHAIVHRRDGDFSNSKYWFDRVSSTEEGRRSIDELRSAVDDLARSPLANDAVFAAAWSASNAAIRAIVGARFDPKAFVDVCARAAKSSPETVRAGRLIQHLEWSLLFERSRKESNR
jgi:hypothetical protein